MQHHHRRGRDNSVQFDCNEKFPGARPLYPMKRDILVSLSEGVDILVFESKTDSRIYHSQVVQNRKIR